MSGVARRIPRFELVHALRRVVVASAVAVVVAAGVVAVRPAPGRAQAAPDPAVRIESAVWEVGAPGAWSALTVRVANGARRPLSGEVVLTPVAATTTEPAVTPDGSPSPTDPSPGPVGDLSPPPPAAGPLAASYREPLAVAAGATTTVVVPLVADDATFAVQVVDRAGRVRAEVGQPLSAVPANADLVGVVGGDRFAAGRLLSGIGAQRSTRFSSGADLPGQARALVGLRAVVLHRIDGASLRDDQLSALRYLVGLGGALVLAGGQPAIGLPADLAPLAPSGQASTDLAAVAELTGIEGEEAVAVTTGEVRAGRVVLQGRDGTPLLVEAPFGAGRIVQATFDPAAVAGGTGAARPVPRLVQAAWGVALGRAGIGTARFEGAGEPPARPDEPAADVLDVTAPPAPAGSPAVALPALVAYALALPVGYWWLRARGRPGRGWRLAPAGALGVALVVLGVGQGPAGRRLVEEHLQVQRVGAGGTMQVESWHRLTSAGGTATLALAEKGSASVGPAESRQAHVLDPLAAIVGNEPPSPARAGPDTIAAGKPGRVLLGHWPAGNRRTVRTLSPASGGGLDAELRLTGGRLQGRVVNGSTQTVRHLVARTPDGSRAALAEAVPPGRSVAVDAPLVAPGEAPVEAAGAEAPDSLETAGGRDRVDLYAFALRAGTAGPGQVDLVGQVPARADLHVQGRPLPGRSLAARVATVALAGADDSGYGLSRPRAVYAGSPQGPFVYDITLAGRPGRPLVLDGDDLEATSGPTSVEVFNWSTRTWTSRPGLTVGRAVAVAPEEIGNNTVRVRTQGRGLLPGLAVRPA